MGALQSSISIGSTGIIITITETPSYVCGNYDSTQYYAQNSATGEYELISTDAVETITYAINNLTPGRTWQETVLLIGNFSFDKTLTLSSSYVHLDCSRAQLSLSAYTILLDVSGDNNIISGGHWIGPSAGTAQAIQFMYAQNCVLKDAEIEGFPSYYGAVAIGYHSGSITIENCWIHDNGAGTPCINIGVTYGYHRIINSKLGNSGMGVMVQGGTGDVIQHNQISGNEFYGWRTGSGTQCHGIYIDGHGGSNEGYNIISGNSFHDPHDGAGILIKSQNNDVYNNVFYNFLTTASVGMSIYSQYSTCTANDNKIHNNTFTDIYQAIWFGSNVAESPTLRNKVYDNTFIRVTKGIALNHDASSQNNDDTWIYYNSFVSCSDIFPTSSSSTDTIHNTVVAYNDFGKTVTQLSILSYVNTMVYGNTGMADFNVPETKQILPP